MSTMQIIIFAAVFVTLVLLILFYDRIRRSKIFQNSEDKAAERAARKAAKEEEYFRRTSQKHYRKEEYRPADFDKDYFKSVDDSQEKKTAETPNDSARRTTTSSDGVTIIDDRQPAKDTQKKKIFEGDEGEYVEFEEV